MGSQFSDDHAFSLSVQRHVLDADGLFRYRDLIA